MHKANNKVHGLSAVFMAVILLIVCAAASQAEDNSFKVYWNYNYPNAPQAETQMVEAGGILSEPAEPSRDDYVFTGWYTNVVCNEPYDFADPVTANLRLFAGWMPTSISVIYYLQNGTNDTFIQTVAVGGKIASPDDPVYEGYDFVGWFGNAAGTTPFDFSQPAPVYNLTAYASYIQQMATVTLVLYDDQQISYQVELDQSLMVPQEPQRSGYVFDGWYVSATGTNEYDFSATISGDVRVYAHWMKTEATVTFSDNFDGGKETNITVGIGTAAQAPVPPQREGYQFTDWYLDASCSIKYDFTQAVKDDITIYAGWELMEYLVTFDDNYQGGTTMGVTVLFGQTVEVPADPARDGYDFLGWYQDAACTKMFAMSTPVKQEVTLYAGWQSRETTGDRVVSYLFNYDDMGEYTSQTYTSTRRLKEPDVPSRSGYYFAGWAKDPQGDVMFDFSSERSAASMTLYAVWLKGYTFEAEYTNLEGKPGQGSSDNCMGVDLIQSPKDIVGNGTQMGMSNGYYVGKLYYNGAFLEFRINAEEDVSNVVLAARLTPDLFNMYFTDETWQVIVNGEQLKYGKISLTGAIAQTDIDEQGNTINGDIFKRPFENYVLSTDLQLKAGENVIRLVTNNKEDHGGTFNAETPLIDCLYLFATAELTWVESHPENVGKTMADVTYDITFDVSVD